MALAICDQFALCWGMFEFGDQRLPRKFWERVKVTGECWLWIGAENGTGYGAFHATKKLQLAHRVAFATLVRFPDDTKVIDHLCRNKLCVNPQHLDEVPQIENVRRGNAGKAQRERTHCPKGHPYNEENTYRAPKNGKRQCKECRRIACRPSEQRKRAGLPPGRAPKSSPI